MEAPNGGTCTCKPQSSGTSSKSKAASTTSKKKKKPVASTTPAEPADEDVIDPLIWFLAGGRGRKVVSKTRLKAWKKRQHAATPRGFWAECWWVIAGHKTPATKAKA